MRPLFAFTLAFALALAGCGASDPCDGHAGACVSLRVEDRGGVGSVDQLAIRFSGAAQLDGRTPTTPAAAVTLPIATAIYLPATSGSVDVTVEGFRGGASVGAGAATTSLAAGTHVRLTIGLTAGVAGGDLALVGDLAGGGSDGGGDLASADLAGLAPRMAFLLPLHGSNLGAQSGLDSECTTAAANARLPATAYRAVIAYPTVNPHDVIDLSAGRAIVLPDGSPVASDATFFTPTHAGPINRLADSTVVSGCVFTDFNPNGDRIAASAGDCGGWTGGAAADVAYVGDPSKTDSNWTFANTAPCATMQCYIYCLQQ
jgi:hypothetical protein